MDALERTHLDEAFRRRDPQGAVALRAAWVREPTHELVNHYLGLLAFERGDLAEAERHFRMAASSAPFDPERHNNLGVVLHALGDPASAVKNFEAATALNPDFVQAINNHGAALAAAGDDAGAIEAYRRALALDPAYVEARDNLEQACSRSAPPWHFPMMADTARNKAYEAAISRASPGRHVLDIGTGSGLLAMMAARAGAAKVDTCETVAPIAATAARIIAANGFSERVSVHSKHSDAMVVGEDLSRRADLLVTETFASGLLSEGVLPALERAWRDLLAPDAQVIPSRAAAHGYLVGGEDIEAHLFAPTATGFDLSAFDLFAPAKVGLHLDRIPHEALSADFEIFAFDLMQTWFAPQRKVIEVAVTQAGRCVGVAQWLNLQLDAESNYENRPRASAGANGWMHVLYRFDRPMDLKVGDTVRLAAGHSRTSMTIAPAT